jgi:hypothetical protein
VTAQAPQDQVVALRCEHSVLSAPTSVIVRDHTIMAVDHDR